MPISVLIIALALLTFTLAGEALPRIRPTAPRVRRWWINGGSALLASAVAGLIWYWPNRQLPAAPDAASSLSWSGFALMLMVYDFALWGWHRLMHEWGWLWRFHRFHHLDPELDASTGLRFHPMEFILSGFWRWGLLALLQPSVMEWGAVTTTVTVLALFHHGRLLLPAKLEQVLEWVVVTPRWHHSHHHPQRQWHDGHYGVILTLWDRLFRTAQSAPDLRLGLHGAAPEQGWRWGELWRAFR